MHACRSAERSGCSAQQTAPGAAQRHALHTCKRGGMMRLKTLIELESSNVSTRVVRAYPLIELRQTVPCRRIRGNRISVISILPPPLQHVHYKDWRMLCLAQNAVAVAVTGFRHQIASCVCQLCLTFIPLGKDIP